MATSKPADGEPTESTKIRCFVFIAGVPSTLTADELKKIMRDQTNDLMEVKILDAAEGVDEDGKHFALALFGSQRAALATCKQGITIDGEDQPLRLFAMSGEKKASVEKVFSDSIEVEGDIVPKASLAVTAGLAAALKGQATAKWCAQTKMDEDCPLGNSCRFIHRRSTQRTARRQRSVEFEEGLGEGIPRPEWFLKDNLSTYFPSDVVEATQSTFVALTNAELSDFIQRAEKISSARQQPQHAEAFPAALQSLVEKLKGTHSALISKGTSPSGLYFPKLNVAQGAPTDTPFSDAPISSALAQRLLASFNSQSTWIDVIKRQVPFPEGGLPTPTRRDRYCLKLWLQAQRNLQCDVNGSAEQFAEKVLVTLLSSERVLVAAKRFRDQKPAETAAPSEKSGLSICLAPWLDIPSPFHCVRLFYMQGETYCALQKDDLLLHNAVETPENIITIETAIDRAVQSINQRITANFVDASLASHIIREFHSVPKSIASSAQYTFCVDVVVVPGRSEAVILSVEEFASSAANNALFPAEPLNTLTTRFRVRKSCETQHLPREWLKIITR